jgi:hypothetical protein
LACVLQRNPYSIIGRAIHNQIPTVRYPTTIDLTFLAFVVFFAREVVGVERSLKANNGLVGENIWSFGQVIASSLI